MASVIFKQNIKDMLESATRAKHFLDSGYTIHGRNAHGETLLHLVKTPELVKFLLDEGLNPNAQNMYGDTPLHSVKNVETAKLLVEAGANINIKNNTRHTPLDTVETFELEQYLVEVGAEITQYIYQRYFFKFGRHHRLISNADVIQFYLSYGADPNVCDHHFRKPLHLAIDYNNYKLAKILLSYGANPNAADDTGRLPIHNAIDEDMVMILYEHGARLSMINPEDNRTRLKYHCLLDIWDEYIENETKHTILLMAQLFQDQRMMVWTLEQDKLMNSSIYRSCKLLGQLLPYNGPVREVISYV